MKYTELKKEERAIREDLRNDPEKTIGLIILLIILIMMAGGVIMYSSGYLGKKGEMAATPQVAIQPNQQKSDRGFSGIVIRNNLIVNARVGVSTPKDADVDLDSNNFVNNQKAIEIRD
jgi:hypothetical protein